MSANTTFFIGFSHEIKGLNHFHLRKDENSQNFVLEILPNDRESKNVDIPEMWNSIFLTPASHMGKRQMTHHRKYFTH